MSEQIGLAPETVGEENTGRLRRLQRFLGAITDLSPLRDGAGIRPIAILFAFGLVSGIEGTAWSILQPEIKHDLGLNFLQFAALTSAIGTGGLLFAGPLGWVGDRANRVLLLGGSAVLEALASIATGFAFTPVTMGASRVFKSLGGELSLMPLISLYADWYPVSVWARLTSLLRLPHQLSSIATPLLVGWLAVTYGWRLPFFVGGALMLPLTLVILRLPNPPRGYMVRRAQGMSESSALRQQPPPSFNEAFRTVWAVRTLRWTFYASLVTGIAGGANGFLSQFFYAEKFHLDALHRALITQGQSLIGVVAIVITAGAVDYFVRLRPQRVLMINALLSIVGAISSIAFVLSGNLAVSIAFGMVTTVISSAIGPAVTAAQMQVQPAKVRTTAVSIGIYFGLPAAFLAPLLGGYLAQHYGLQVGMLAIFPFLLTGSLIHAYAARFFESDMRNAQHSAVANLDWEESVRTGQAKQLVCRRLDVHYGTVQVLHGVDFDVRDGELMAVLGTNGGGKSTLLRAITGLSEASAGAVVFEGADITHVPPNEIASRGLVYIRGGQSGFPSLTVAENLKMGSWLHHRASNHAEALERVHRYFPILRERSHQAVGTLSGGEQQMVALAQAFLARPRMLLIDELSLGLAPAIVDGLIEIVRDINRSGTTVVVVEQSVTTALRLADRVLFLERGRVRFDGPAQDLTGRSDILRSIYLAAGSGQGPSRAPAPSRGEPAPGPLLEVAGVTKRFGGRHVIDDVTFNLDEGRILGVIGANGAGKTTLFDLISGYTPVDAGTIRLSGQDVTVLTPDARARLGLIRRFQDARLFPTLTVAETIAVAFERQLEVRNMVVLGLDLPAGRASEKKVRARVSELIRLLGLEPFRDKFVSDLSTGSRRLVDLACSIAAGARVLLLDEPSAGVAERETEAMVPLLQRVRFQTGCAMLLIDHDMTLVAAVADEMMALHLGRILVRADPRSVLDDPRVQAAYLGREPEPVAS